MSEVAPPTISPHAVIDATPRNELSRRGKGFIALTGTLLFAGIGHLIAGRTRRGVGWILISIVGAGICLGVLAIPRLVPALIVLAPLNLLLSLACFVDAYLCGRRAAGDLLRRPTWRYLAGITLIAIAFFVQPATWVARAVRANLVEGFFMPTGSMIPTVSPGDRVLCHKLVQPARWSVMVVRTPDEMVIKRLVGLPGETIEIIKSALFINGRAVTPPAGIVYTSYISNGGPKIPIYGPGCEGDPITLGSDEYYFLGDNSPISSDARFWSPLPGHQRGALTSDRIVGTVTYVYWPVARWRRL